MNAALSYNGTQRNQRQALIQLFYHVVSTGKRRQFFSLFTRKANSLYTLDKGNATKNSRLPAIKTINLDEIVGSEGRIGDFDNRFNPLKRQSRERWVSIALANSNNKALPPIQLIQTDEGYFVRDGHHRVSVARVFGQVSIEAEIV